MRASKDGGAQLARKSRTTRSGPRGASYRLSCLEAALCICAQGKYGPPEGLLGEESLFPSSAVPLKLSKSCDGGRFCCTFDLEGVAQKLLATPQLARNHALRAERATIARTPKLRVNACVFPIEFRMFAPPAPNKIAGCRYLA